MSRSFLMFVAMSSILCCVVSLNLTASPPETTEGSGETISIVCSLDDLTNITSVQLISILRNDQPHPLAIIYQIENKTISDSFAPSTEVKGMIDQITPQNSFIELAFTKPTKTISGRYRCDVIFSDRQGLTSTSEHVQLEVTDLVSQFINIQKEMAKQMQETFDLIQHELNKTQENVKSNERRIDQISNKMNKKMDALKEDTHQRLDTVFDNFNQLTKKVNKLIDFHKKCPKGWTKFRNQCFKYFKQWITWHQARDHCRSLGAYLPEIPDAQTNAFIRTIAKDARPTVWIGLNDRATEGAYVWDWSSRALSSYTNWASYEPNTRRDEFDCVYMWSSSGKWYIGSSTNGRSWFICQRVTELI